jgi:hypothetical protein
VTRSLLALACLFAPSAACTGETGVNAGEAEMVLSTQTIDFGEVPIGSQTTIGITIENDGIGELSIEDVSLDGTTSADFELVGIDLTTIGRQDQAQLQVRYAPTAVGQDYGRVVLSTNDPKALQAEIDLAAFGTEPRVDLDPETLWFGTVAVGETKTLEARVTATGTGTLKIRGVEFAGDEALAFSVTPPDGVTYPYALGLGYSITYQVSFTPPDDQSWSGSLVFDTNDPVTPTVALSLLGNAEDPGGNDDPEVELTDPDWGQDFVEGESVLLAGSVYDQESALDQLICLFYAGTTPLGSAMPDADGYLSLATTALPVGDVQIILKCLDPDGGVGSDSVEVEVFDAEEPLPYTITGGDSLFDYWGVDDDVTIYVDGVAVFSDTNHTQDNHPPVEFEAAVGSVIRIVANDVNYCQASLDALTLHFGAGRSQALNDDQCVSACTDDACYDASYTGPWPGTFFDESFTIAIP